MSAMSYPTVSQWVQQQQAMAALAYNPVLFSQQLANPMLRTAASPFPVSAPDPQRRYETIAKYIVDVPGRRRLAASMIQPLRRRRDYSTVGRKAFYVEQLPDGALPIYDKDQPSVARFAA